MTKILVAAVLLSGAAGAAAQSAPPLPLAAALALARDALPEVAAATARVDAAREASQLAGRLPNPAIEVRSENWASGAPDPGLPLDVFATVTQAVELGGKRRARVGVSAAGVSSAEAFRAVVLNRAALDVSRVYLDAVRLRDRARAQRDHAASLGEATRVMRRRVEVGTAPESDLLKLVTEEARAALDLTRSTLGAARAVALLGARLGTDVDPEQLQLPAVPAVPAEGAVLVDRLPDLAAARSAVTAATGLVDLERARGVPDLAVNAGVKRTAGYTTGVAALTVGLPIFDRNGLARALAAGHLRAVQLDAQAVERRLRGEFAATRAAAVSLGERAAWAPAGLVEPARAARDAARAAFAAGALDVLRLVDAERVFAEASALSVELTVDAVAAAIEVRLASGREPLP